MIFFIAIPILMYKSLKYTIQRFYDLGLSGWYILLKLIPIFSVFVTIYLYFKKGNSEINEYDEAINYKKLFRNKHFIDIHEKMFFVDNFEYQYERYLGKYIIKISYYEEINFFTEYLFKYFTIDEFNNIIKSLNLIIINKSFYINIKEFKVYIRKEDFKYTIIIDKNINNVSKELFKLFDFPGAYFEDDDYIYYNKIYKEKLLEWIKNVA